MGHYFNLVHTFYGDKCDAAADGCTDTPAQREPHYKCERDTDTCKQNVGNDPVWNFMDYSLDSCMVRFTSCQVERMRLSLVAHRPKLLAASRVNALGNVCATTDCGVHGDHDIVDLFPATPGCRCRCDVGFYGLR